MLSKEINLIKQFHELDEIKSLISMIIDYIHLHDIDLHVQSATSQYIINVNGGNDTLSFTIKYKILDSKWPFDDHIIGDRLNEIGVFQKYNTYIRENFRDFIFLDDLDSFFKQIPNVAGLNSLDFLFMISIPNFEKYILKNKLKILIQ